MPVIKETLKDLKGKRVLDLGCGDGKYTRILAEKGAIVTAIDFSEKQIEKAKEKNSQENITYFVCDAGDMKNISNNSIEFVFMNLVVPSLENKKKLIEVLTEIKRVLKQNGEFLFVVLHPLYVLSKHNLDHPTDFDVRNYFNEGSSYHAEALTNKDNKMIFEESHFSLTYITKIMNENDLVIKRLIESKEVPEEEHYLPAYLIIEGIHFKQQSLNPRQSLES